MPLVSVIVLVYKVKKGKVGKGNCYGEIYACISYRTCF
jgi:hypothetical protein